MVLQLDNILFVIAKPTSIHTCLLVHVPKATRDVFENLLEMYNKHLLPIYDSTAAFPALRDEVNWCIQSGGTKHPPEIVTLSCIVQKIGDRQALVSLLQRIVPTLVHYWNNTKGHIDVQSRYLSHLNLRCSDVSVTFYVLLRFLFLVVNSFLAKKMIVEGEKFIGKRESLRAFKHKIGNDIRLHSSILFVACGYVIGKLKMRMEIA
jgi:hypothetical protein